jgi:hypothetical protein
MSLQKLCQWYNCGLTIAGRIGARNIIFFGLLGSAVTVEYICHKQLLLEQRGR